MSPDQLNEIEQRAKAASPGPWRVSKRDPKFVINDGKRERYFQAQTSPHDAVFIAHARQDIPALIAEVRRLRSHIEILGVLASDGAATAFKDDADKYKFIAATAKQILGPISH